MTSDDNQPTDPKAPHTVIRETVAGLKDDIGRQFNDPTPIYVALGASDAIAEQARKVAATAARQGAELASRARTWNTAASADASEVPRQAISAALRVAGQVEAAYGDLATRGRTVADRVREGGASAELVRRAMLTLARTRSSSTTVRPGSGAVIVGETVATPSQTAAEAEAELAVAEAEAILAGDLDHADEQDDADEQDHADDQDHADEQDDTAVPATDDGLAPESDREAER